ncbi:methylated-DNA--[protein]-cysteine S-methyltransferase [Mycobacterium sp. DL440]|uniref:methylated-DNA--[protein]-cysteine S-methyltransferase n=1 Tax=Mycobacterium sp. DL440 TaxID=2675523 RepID=UPI00353048B7
MTDGTDTMTTLRARLAVAADRDDILDVAYRTIDSPVGPLLVAATEQGLVRVAYAREDHDVVLQQLADKVSPRILRTPTRLDAVARELDEYFAGHRRTFDIVLDWRLSAGFRSTVLHHLPDIGYGHTASYAAVAQLAGNPKAVRAVGTACATNPLPVVVPCHRVVRSDGAMGGYLGGVEAKRILLDLEAAA